MNKKTLWNFVSGLARHRRNLVNRGRRVTAVPCADRDFSGEGGLSAANLLHSGADSSNANDANADSGPCATQTPANHQLLPGVFGFTTKAPKGIRPL